MLGSVHMVLKNLPWAAEWLASAGLRRPSRPRSLQHAPDDRRRRDADCDGALLVRPAADRRTAAGERRPRAGSLLVHRLRASVFYVAFVANGIAIGMRVRDGWEYQAAKASMGDWYRAPVGMGRRRDGDRLLVLRGDRVPDRLPGAARARARSRTATSGSSSRPAPPGLTVGTVQGVIQVQPSNADWLFRAGHAGEWIDPIAHAHINLVTGLTMLTAGALFYFAPLLGGRAPSRRTVNACFYALLAGSLAFYGVGHVPRVPRGVSGRRARPDPGAGRGSDRGSIRS